MVASFRFAKICRKRLFACGNLEISLARNEQKLFVRMSTSSDVACAICLDSHCDVTNNSSVVIATCKHEFGRACLDRYISHVMCSRAKDSRGSRAMTCPVCRRVFSTHHVRSVGSSDVDPHPAAATSSSATHARVRLDSCGLTPARFSKTLIKLIATHHTDDVIALCANSASSLHVTSSGITKRFAAPVTSAFTAAIDGAPVQCGEDEAERGYVVVDRNTVPEAVGRAVVMCE